MPDEQYTRQSFLGENAQTTFQKIKIAVIGLGGGGSHIVQQLAHIGFQNYLLFDPQTIEETNLNRVVGAQHTDVGSLKVSIAKRIILGVQPEADVCKVTGNWQDSPELIRGCDVIFGCVDTFKDRNELEASARRYFIPYIDIGMDVFSVEGEPPRMAGQVILSLPGNHCLRCLEFITESKLALEASNYGATGARPQVVWPNAILASSAVGILVDLLTGWTGFDSLQKYLSYDGNNMTLTPHIRLNYELPEECTHYPAKLAGDPQYTTI